jgi:hypothetical protein
MLKQQTGLNYSFALQCLADNNWNMATALESFERLKVRQTEHCSIFSPYSQCLHALFQNINAIPPEAYGS